MKTKRPFATLFVVSATRGVGAGPQHSLGLGRKCTRVPCLCLGAPSVENAANASHRFPPDDGTSGRVDLSFVFSRLSQAASALGPCGRGRPVPASLQKRAGRLRSGPVSGRQRREKTLAFPDVTTKLTSRSQTGVGSLQAGALRCDGLSMAWYSGQLAGDPLPLVTPA